MQTRNNSPGSLLTCFYKDLSSALSRFLINVSNFSPRPMYKVFPDWQFASHRSKLLVLPQRRTLQFWGTRARWQCVPVADVAPPTRTVTLPAHALSTDTRAQGARPERFHERDALQFLTPGLQRHSLKDSSKGSPLPFHPVPLFCFT